jgi:uncharacterized membrane protein
MIVTSAFVLVLLHGLKAKPRGDVALYDRIATDVVEGRRPYRDQPIEYPPYVIPLFLLPRLCGKEGFLWAFPWLAFLGDLSVKLVLLAAGLRQIKSLRGLIPLTFYCVGAFFLAHLYFFRYDVFPALFSLIGIIAFTRNRYTLSGAAIAVGIGLKLYPVVLVPTLLVLSWRKGKLPPFSLGLLLGLLPLVGMGFFMPWWRFAAFHASRGFQAESTYAVILWGGKLLGAWSAIWFHASAWTEVHGLAATALLPWARLLWGGATLFSVAFASWVALRQSELSPANLAELLLIPLLAFIVFNLVFSPQYMIWILPLAALAALKKKPVVALAVLMATMTTPFFFPSLFHDYDQGINLFETLVLLSRNLLLGVIWIALIVGQIRAYRSRDESITLASNRLNSLI